MSSVYYKIGQLFKQKEAEMVNGRVTQVNTDTSNKDSAVSNITSDKDTKFGTLNSDIAAAKTAKEAALLAKKNELATAISALLTNATAEVDSITDLINYLNANNSDWISTLDQKQTDLTAALDAQKLSLGDFSGFEAAWGVIYTRSTAAVPSTDLALHLKISDSTSYPSGNFPAEGEDVPTLNFDGGSLTQAVVAKQPKFYPSGKNMYNGITNSQDAIYLHEPTLYCHGADGYDFTPLAWDNGFTYAFAFCPNSKRYSGGSYRIMLKANDANGTNTDLDITAWENMDASNDKCKIRLRWKPDGQTYIHQYDSLEGVIVPHELNTIIVVWDGSAEKPTVKVNGAEVEFGTHSTKTGQYNKSQYPYYDSYAHYGVYGDFAAFSSGLSGNDLDSLEAYYNFKYINYADSEVMFNEANWGDIMGHTVGNPPGGTSTSISGFDNAQVSFLVRTEKMIKVGSRAEIQYSSDEYGYNKPNQLIITEDLEWQSKNDQYGYYQTDIKNSSAAYLIKAASNFLYLYYSDGAGNMNLVHNANTSLTSTDVISLIVEWDGTVKFGLNGTVLYTAADKFTVGNYVAPFIWSQRRGEGSISMDGNLVDFAWPSNYSSETASDATPVKDSGNSVVTSNHINHGSNPMGKGGKVKVGTLQGEGAYIDWQPHPFHGSNRYIMTLSTTADVWNYNDANAEIAMRAAYMSGQQYVYTSGTADHLMTRTGLSGHTSWADYYNDISNSYEGDTDINKYGFGRMRIQFYDDHVIFWGNGYPIYRVDGIDTSQQYYVNINLNDVTWSPGFEDIKIYNP